MNHTSLFRTLVPVVLSLASCRESQSTRQASAELPESIAVKNQVLLDRIKGGWAGQTIGVTYGGPAEFRFNGTMMQDYIPIEWDEDLIEWFYDNAPGLYDDIYMDLTFVDILEKKGLDAPTEDFAQAFAHAEYPLWHANQAARYNILNGTKAPESGHWKYSMHSDDIDFQIESDFAGLMSPGMINAASGICDRVGHIMNYGDGYYAGVYVAAMYAMAFVTDDVHTVITEALKVVPEESKYYRCMTDVLKFYKEHPDNWKDAWFEIETSEWAQDLHCPDGIFAPFNIDATVNSAYVLLGLLYGGGDFEKSMEIAARAGQDADCNPATVGGILGTMMGYGKIPPKYMNGIKRVEDRDFKYTNLSLNDVYALSYKHALQNIQANGGSVNDTMTTIAVQEVKQLPFEEAYPGIYPRGYLKRGWGPVFTMENDSSKILSFRGNGIVIKGHLSQGIPVDYVGEVEITIDGVLDRIQKLPADNLKRALELYWNVNLPEGEHLLELKWLNPYEGGSIVSDGYFAFTGEIQ